MAPKPSLNSPNVKLTIIKCGGSLLNLPDLSRKVIELVDAHQLSPALLVVGGGQLADDVRTRQLQDDLTDSVAHDSAIQAMTQNAQQLAASHERFQLVPSVQAVERHSPTAIPILEVAVVIEELEKLHRPLPRSWDITSDSIAAWLAGILQADGLLLLKSIPLPESHAPGNLQQLTGAGLVDRGFPQFAAKLPQIAWCNLRSETPTLQIV